MLHFQCDYLMGAHPKLLSRLMETNLEPCPGYGSDPYTLSARQKIATACGCPQAQVYFITGGTQTNRIVIDGMLCACEGVIASTTGHISLHEAGAIEASGHKVLQLPHRDGKLSADTVKTYLHSHYDDPNHPHMVAPGMVYISHPTEYGTLYSLEELEALSQVCRQYQIPLFLDGARLGYGLMSTHTDVTLQDIARVCDVFYIGGTKVGALCGEAVVFPQGNAPRNFFSFIKQNGALLAKGRLLGVQFDALFTDELYFTISRHAIVMAEKLRELFLKKGYRLHLNSPTNQQFILLTDDRMQSLSQKVCFDFWERLADGTNVVRFATSWATTEEDLLSLEQIL